MATPNDDRPPAAAPLLGFAALFSVAIGVIVAQSTLVSLLQAVAIAGSGFVFALAIGWLLMACNSATFAELALMMPRAGGLSAYVRAGLGHWAAIFAVFAGYVVPALFGPAAELLLVDAVMAELLPRLALPPLAWGALLLGVLLVLNLLGTDVFARVQTALTFTMLAFLLLTGLIAFAGGGGSDATAATARATNWAAMSQGTTVFGVVALVMYSIIGTEFVTPLTAVAKRPERDVPRAMFLGLTVVAVVNLVFVLGAAALVGREKLGAAPLPHLDAAVAAWGPSVRVVFAVIALVATASLVNTVLGAVPRMLHEMALAGQVFPVFRRVNARGVPWVGTLFMAALPVVGLVWARGDVNRIVPLLVAAASAWLVAYMIAHLALLALRRRAPQAARPYRVPATPVPQVVAIAGLGYVIAHAAPVPELEGPIFGALAVVLGTVAVVGALWVRLAMREPLFAPGGVDRS